LITVHRETRNRIAKDASHLQQQGVWTNALK